ncbi:hypothetical protein M3J09_004060 [Ascochyta lentis]
MGKLLTLYPHSQRPKTNKRNTSSSPRFSCKYPPSIHLPPYTTTDLLILPTLPVPASAHAPRRNCRPPSRPPFRESRIVGVGTRTVIVSSYRPSPR